MNEIANSFIRIPNVVANNKNVSLGAKYLYGYIWYWTYYGEFVKSNEDVCEALNVTLNTIRKYLKELKQAGFIKITIVNNNERHIQLLVTDEFIMRESARIKNKDLLQARIAAEQDQPEYIKQFLANIK